MSGSEQLFELVCHCRWNVSSSQDVSRHNRMVVPPFKIHTCRNCSMAWIFSSTTYHTTASVTPVTMPKTQNNYPCAECWNWTKSALTLKTGLKVREGHWKCHHSIESLWPWNPGHRLITPARWVLVLHVWCCAILACLGLKWIGTPVEKNYTISRPIFSSTINSLAYCLSTR